MYSKSWKLLKKFEPSGRWYESHLAMQHLFGFVLKNKKNMVVKICVTILLLTSMCVIFFSKQKDSAQVGFLMMILAWLMLIYDKIN